MQIYECFLPQKQTSQIGLFSSLADILDQKHPMYQFAGKINWPLFDNVFKKHYSEKTGTLSKPIRLMLLLLILKYVPNLSDENQFEKLEKQGVHLKPKNLLKAVEE